MKKVLFILTLVLMVGFAATFVYAQNPATTSDSSAEQWREWFEEKVNWKKSQVQEAVDNGTITKDEAETWNSHFDYMEEFHSENGFIPGGCHGDGYGRGPGMMRGYRWNR